MNWDKSYISELKADGSSGPMIEINQIENYKIKILHRGEQLFYYDMLNDRALIVEIQIRNGSVFEKSIAKWDSGAKVDTDEKANIISRILNYFKVFQKMEAVVR